MKVVPYARCESPWVGTPEGEDAQRAELDRIVSGSLYRKQKACFACLDVHRVHAWDAELEEILSASKIGHHTLWENHYDQKEDVEVK